MTTLLSYPQRRRFTHTVQMWTAGSPPPPTVIRRFTAELGVQVRTAYGLTESYGPISTHIPLPEWTSKEKSILVLLYCDVYLLSYSIRCLIFVLIMFVCTE